MNIDEINQNVTGKVQSKTRIDDDGIEMEWNEEKKAWFPNIDEEFIYRHNLDYGFVKEEKNEEPVEEAPAPNYPDWYHCLWKDFLELCKSENIDPTKMPLEEYNNKWDTFYYENAEKYEKKKVKPKKRPAKANDPTWFEVDENQNKHIYVENMPLDIKVEEFVEIASKYGLLMYEPFTNIPKAKLYKDIDGNFKGDGICCYLKVESVDLALSLLDGYNLRGSVIKVSRAKFELKGDFDPKKRRRITNKEKRKLEKQRDNLLRWGPETKTRAKKDNTVILKNVFDTQLMKENPELVFDLKDKINKEAKNIGAFRSIQVHDLHPEAVVQINFQDPNLSDIAIAYFNNKIWNGRKVTAELWDGRTKYKIKETAEEEKERLDKWEKTLEGKREQEEKEQDKCLLENLENKSEENVECSEEPDEEEYQEGLNDFVKILECEEEVTENTESTSSSESSDVGEPVEATPDEEDDLDLPGSPNDETDSS